MSTPIAVTLGDPAGIGPEVLAKTLVDPALGALGRRLVVLGPAWAVRDGLALAGASDLPVRVVAAAEAATGAPGIDVIDVGVARPPDFRIGEVQAACGSAAVQAIEQAARLALAGRVSAMVTCPIHKEAVQAAGYHADLGHQEILARVTGATLTATMLMTGRLRVVHLSTHLSLADAVRFVTRARVLAKTRLAVECLARWGLARPRVAIAALNPHGGEGGMLGREEIDELAPAVADLRSDGIDAHGPLPADSVFNRAINGEFDVVLALYHDQGHIAIKVHGFADSITVTMGIPFLRTSVDHGTAFDIAGRGVADHTGLLRAIEAADCLLAGRLRA
jgi:4-hydroxythreonine-4-phosphate dehydrogenase